MYDPHALPPVDLEEIRGIIGCYKDGENFLRLMADHFKFHSDEFRLISKAHELVVNDFSGTLRRSGEEFIEHLRGTAIICFCIRGDKSHTSVLERLLHDWREDVEHSTYHDLYLKFGAVVSHTVAGVTESEIERPSGMCDIEFKRLKQTLKFGKVVKHGVRSMLVKCDDRNHNMLTLWGTPEEKLNKIIETMEWVIPISIRSNDKLLLELVTACTEQLDRLHVNDKFSGLI